MPEELKTLLIILATCLPIGLFVGIAIRKLAPSWCKSYAKFCMSGRWWVYAFGLLLFTGLSIISFVDDRFYFGVGFTLFACAEAFGLFAWGFKKLTPEQAARIDAADPSKLWPLRFWKQTRNGEQPAGGDAEDRPPQP